MYCTTKMAFLIFSAIHSGLFFPISLSVLTLDLIFIFAALSSECLYFLNWWIFFPPSFSAQYKEPHEDRLPHFHVLHLISPYFPSVWSLSITRDMLEVTLTSRCTFLFVRSLYSLRLWSVFYFIFSFSSSVISQGTPDKMKHLSLPIFFFRPLPRSSPPFCPSQRRWLIQTLLFCPRLNQHPSGTR